MTVKYYAGDKIGGLSSDSKPTTVLTGATFFETDTSALFVYNGSSWVQQAASSLSNGTTGTAGSNIVLATSPTIASPTFNTSITTNYLTTGSILFAGASANITQDNANLFWDNTNNRLGIGTTNPTRQLTINGSLYLASFTNGTQDLNIYAGVNYLGVGSARVGDDLRLYVDDTSTRGIDIQTGTGNVGIGTTNPTAKLHIVDGGTSGLTTLSLNNRIDFAGDGTMKWGASANQGRLTWDTGIARVAGMTGNNLSLGANGIYDYLTVIGGGNVGIGTTNPEQKLEVKGTDDTYMQVKTTGADSTAGYVLYNDVRSWVIRTEGGDGDKFQIRDATANAQRLTIDSSGNVGIGTTNPLGILDVLPAASGYFLLGGDQNAQSRTDNTLKFARFFTPHYTNAEEPITILTATSGQTYSSINIGGGTTAGNAATAIIFTTAANITTTTGTERMRVDNNGNVGIGTTSPEQLLTLSTAISNVPLGLYSSSANAANRNWVIQSNSIIYGDFDIRQSNAIFGNPVSAGTSRFYIANDGKIGIGTTSPETLLHLKTTNTSETNILRLENAGAWSNNQLTNIDWQDQTGATTGAIGAKYFAGGDVAILFHSLYNGGYKTSSDVVMAIRGSGNVGIGTAAPVDAITIGGATTKRAITRELDNTSMAIYGGSTEANGAYFRVTGVNYATSPGQGSAEFVIREVTGVQNSVFAIISYDGASAWTRRFSVIGSTGYVGVGVTAPASLMELQGGLTTVGAVLTLGTKEPTVVVNDVLGRINFYAPLEADGSDARLVGASIVAIAEDTFSATVNKTALHFQTGASEVATTKAILSNTGTFTIGSTATTSSSLAITRNPTGAVTYNGITIGGTIQSDVSTSYVCINSTPATAAAAFTLPNLYHHLVTGATIGSGSTLTTQCGYTVSSTMTTGTYNFGYYGNLALASNVWNLYMVGTANNYMAGNVGIGTSDLDGTPAIGKLTVQGSTADGSTNIIVGRDSGNANVFAVNTDGSVTILSCTMSYNTTTNSLDFTFA